MAEAKKLYWLKLRDDFFSSRRIKKLRSMDHGDTLLTIYLKLQLIAMKDDGLLKCTGLEDTIEQELALDTGEEVSLVKETLDFLLKWKLAEKESDTEIYLPWAVINTQSETADAERKRRERADKKNSCPEESGQSSEEDGQRPDNVRQSPENVRQNKKQTYNQNSELNRDYEKDFWFDKLWNSYPKKSGDIREAFTEYMRATDNGADPEEMLKAIKNLDTSEGIQYLPSMGKWLRNRSWITSQAVAASSIMEELKRRAELTDAILNEEDA